MTRRKKTPHISAAFGIGLIGEALGGHGTDDGGDGGGRGRGGGGDGVIARGERVRDRVEAVVNAGCPNAGGQVVFEVGHLGGLIGTGDDEDAIGGLRADRGGAGSGDCAASGNVVAEDRVEVCDIFREFLLLRGGFQFADDNEHAGGEEAEDGNDGEEFAEGEASLFGGGGLLLEHGMVGLGEKTELC